MLFLKRESTFLLTLSVFQKLSTLSEPSMIDFYYTRLGCFYVTAILIWGWVDVDIEAEVDLNLRWNEDEMRLSPSLVEIELKWSWVGVEISWNWIKEEIGLS